MRPIAFALGAIVCSFSATALADPVLEGRDWRRADRPKYESPQHYAFELRLGPYQPQVDNEFSNGKTPFKDTFGDGKGFHIGFEIDWQALRIPWVGTFGPGFGFAWTRKSATAKVAEGTHKGEDSAQSTSLLILPMHLDGVLRVDVLPREVGIPLVPYGKLGLGFALWRAASDNGVSYANGEVGKGRTWGTHFALGGMLLLDPLDPAAAMGFDEEVGVNNSYLFFEWQWLALNGQLVESRPQMHVGTTGWVAGLAFEFLGGQGERWPLPPTPPTTAFGGERFAQAPRGTVCMRAGARVTRRCGAGTAQHPAAGRAVDARAEATQPAPRWHPATPRCGRGPCPGRFDG